MISLQLFVQSYRSRRTRLKGLGQVSEYDLTLATGETATVRSRYVVSPGQCVVLRRATTSDYVVIVAQDDASCVDIRVD